MQKSFLEVYTIRSNIALGVPEKEIRDEQVWRVLSAARLDSFVASLPHGVDTVVGERGVRISGGQRQRIGIARALYHDPDVLVMDEATSNLDSGTEQAIVESVNNLKGERTVIMIAHRLTTVKNCDCLYFLKGCWVEQTGTYAELFDNHSEFRVMAG